MAKEAQAGAQPGKIRVLELVTLMVKPYSHNPTLTVTRVFDPAINPIISNPDDVALIISHGAEYETIG